MAAQIMIEVFSSGVCVTAEDKVGTTDGWYGPALDPADIFLGAPQFGQNLEPSSAALAPQFPQKFVIVFFLRFPAVPFSGSLSASADASL
jgi:hypothetical protein